MFLLIILSLFGIGAGIGIYFMPTYLAFEADVKYKWWMFLYNLLFGWTIIGWIAVLAFASKERKLKGF